MTSEAPVLTAAIPVLCLFHAFTERRNHKEWFDGAKMIHVVRSADILPEFEAVMASERQAWNPLSMLPRPDGWELVSYRPYNGRPHF